MVDKEKISKEVQEDSEDEDKSELIEILGKEKEQEEESVDESISQIDENRFREFLQPIQTSSPVLEEVTAEQEGPVFVSTFSSASDSEERRREGDSIKYTNEKQYNNVKYVDTPGVGTDFSRVDFEKTGRELHPQLRETAPVNIGIQELDNPHRNQKEDYSIAPKGLDRMKIGKEDRKTREYKVGETPV